MCNIYMQLVVTNNLHYFHNYSQVREVLYEVWIEVLLLRT